MIKSTLRRIPGIIGAIDGTHVPIKAPPHNPVDYYNRNNYHSVILQAICNDKREFIDIFVGVAGRVHDARVFRQSPIFALLSGNNPPIDENQHLLGDNAYPLLPFLMKPYRDNGHLTPEQTKFNTMLSSIRCRIEQCFGLLKGKWRRLKFLDMSRIDLIPTVIVAACVLHNFVLNNEDFEFEDGEYEQDEDENENNLQIFQEFGIGIGNRKRDYIASILQ
ncbi:PREDICTED: putative nuclease HARBI1 [Cyphomyrmex costatus]|uniref:putative nuclease HARBI1 n=1 Tax=Cyphomyrmex costatus TaxID=456900 RepID=UPI00085242D1|nr:PREDICTED: putative nuclease HARBI1 [Cyphomyrmex costatus]